MLGSFSHLYHKMRDWVSQISPVLEFNSYKLSTRKLPGPHHPASSSTHCSCRSRLAPHQAVQPLQGSWKFCLLPIVHHPGNKFPEPITNGCWTWVFLIACALPAVEPTQTLWMFSILCKTFPYSRLILMIPHKFGNAEPS